MHYEGTVIRPPSEANSIILQATVGCSHNHCTFCGAYKDVRFRIKSEVELARDLDFAALHCRRLNRLFVADGDALILPQSRLLALFGQIRAKLPQVNRISLYANGKAIRSKSDEDLVDLKKRGLDRIYLGLESGDDEVLKAVHKGETADSLALAGRRVVQTGIFLSVTVLLGLAGAAASARHARLTAQLVNRIGPNQVAALTLMPLANTKLGRAVRAGTFQLPGVGQIIEEIRALVDGITLERTQFMANHASNYLPLSGRLNRDRERLLAQLDAALSGETPLVPEHLRAL